MVIAVITIALSFLTVFGQALVFIIPPRFTRRKMTYELRMSAPLIHKIIRLDPDWHIAHHGEAVANPYVVQLQLVNCGRRDVKSEFFDQGRPLRIDLGVRLVALLQTTLTPHQLPVPKAGVRGTFLEVGPDLIRQQLTVDFVILADGPVVSLICENPLGDVEVNEHIEDHNKAFTWPKMAQWVLLAFIIWWVVTQPSSAAHLVHAIWIWLSKAANEISNFFVSL